MNVWRSRKKKKKNIYIYLLDKSRKLQNEKRMTLLSALEDSSSSLFTGPGKMSTLGSLHRGDSIVSDEYVSQHTDSIVREKYIGQHTYITLYSP